jgi:NAD(P)-dependent dehydrogenase (short-subunit alcohol dehydrogenase family)
MMAEVTTTLITGANKGLGREAARRLLADGHDVWISARDPARGRAAAEQLGARFVELDVTDDESVRAAAERVAAESGGLDVLVNNAGIAGVRKPVPEVTADDLRYERPVTPRVHAERARLPRLEVGGEHADLAVREGLPTDADQRR